MLGAALPQTSFANNTAFILVNKSSEPIYEVNISSVQSKGWGKDLLGQNVITSGSERSFDMGSSSGCIFDIRVRFKSKKEEERRGVDLCSTERLAFSGLEAKNLSERSAAPPSAGAPSAVRVPSVEDIGTCAGAVTIEFQKGDRETAMKFYSAMKSQIDSHDSLVMKNCSGGRITETCFNSLPLETRKFLNARDAAIKDLNSPAQTNLLNKTARGNDPMTRATVLLGFCSK